MKHLLFILLLIPSLLWADVVGQNSIKIARKDIGITEKTNNNDGPRIREYQRNAGIPAGSPYCVAAVNTWHKESAQQLGKENRLHTVSAAWQLYKIAQANPIRYKFIHVRQIANGTEKLLPGDIILWKTGAVSGAQFKGHGGEVEVQLGPKDIQSIEANTVGLSTGDQRGEGKESVGGVFRKHRKVNNSVNFLILGVVRIR